MTTRSTDRPVRPRNRRELIAEAAGRAFSERGYHAVGMDDIAAAEGITAAALYRHFPNKYALFVHCATRLARGLVTTVDELPADASLDALLAAIAGATVANRASGGIYRWEARYLEPPDRRALRAMFARVTGRVGDAAARAREAAKVGGGPVTPEVQRVLAAAALGAIGSATAHRTTVGARRMEVLLAEAAHRTAMTPIPRTQDGVEVPGAHAERPPEAATAPSRAERPKPSGTVARGGRARGGRRAEILHAAIPLFERDGYAEVPMGAIAAAVGLTPSGLYRHYAGKADILLAACLEAADLLQEAVGHALAGTQTPQEAVGALVGAYIGYSFEHTALTSVATAESGGLPADVQRPLRAAQRQHVGLWEMNLRASRPELDAVDARVLVHAGLGVVTEAGRAVRWQDSAANRALVSCLVLAALGV
jgi:AcrR family transcriptional regulator